MVVQEGLLLLLLLQLLLLRLRLRLRLLAVLATLLAKLLEMIF